MLGLEFAIKAFVIIIFIIISCNSTVALRSKMPVLELKHVLNHDRLEQDLTQSRFK